jgi:hypothetical protein
MVEIVFVWLGEVHPSVFCSGVSINHADLTATFPVSAAESGLEVGSWAKQKTDSKEKASAERKGDLVSISQDTLAGDAWRTQASAGFPTA